MRKAVIRVSKKKDNVGFWNFLKTPLGQIKVKKNDNTFKLDNFEEVDCVVIGGLIYDVKSYNEGIVELSEGVKDDFEGEIFYQESLPIRIKRDSEVADLMIDLEDEFVSKSDRKTIPLNKATKELKIKYMKELEESGKTINPENIMLMIIDTVQDKKVEAKSFLLKSLIESVVHIDMEYEVEEGVNLWQTFELKQGDYVGLAKLLKSKGVLSDLEDIETFKFTIEAIKNNKDVDSFVAEAKIRNLQFRTQMVLSQMKDKFENIEDFKKFAGIEEN